MISSNDLKPGLTILVDGEIYTVLEASQNKTARSAMVVKAKVRNVRTGSNVELSWGGGEKVEPAQIEKREMQYLYDTDESMVFMDNETYEQMPLNKEQLGDSLKFIKENMNVKILSYKGKVFAVEPPMFVELEVTYTEPGFSGNTTTTSGKPATLENGYEISVPLFVNIGDVIKIDTRTGEYMERV